MTLVNPSSLKYMIPNYGFARDRPRTESRHSLDYVDAYSAWFQGEMHWFWDDVQDDPEVDCEADPSTWPHPDIRRCAELKPQNPVKDLEWADYEGILSLPREGLFSFWLGGGSAVFTDFVTISEVGWEGAKSMRFKDSFSAKGAVTDWQFDASGSRDIMDYLTDRLMCMIEEDLSGDAGILASYRLGRDAATFKATMTPVGDE